MKLISLIKRRFIFLIPIFAILGPGIIAGNADNDAGGITTYSVAGANFGFSLLWVLLLTTFALALTQEIGARMGLVTGKGLGALIREKFGVRWTAFVMACLFLSNIGTISAEFAGVAAAMSIFHVSKFVSIPIAIITVFLLVTRGNFKKLERLFLIMSFFYISYIVSAVLAHPDFTHAVKSLIVPNGVKFNGVYILTLMAVIGTTITPWGQFFIQDYVVDKKLTKNDLKIERGDVFLGSFFTNFISFFIIIACTATLFAKGIKITDASQAALALKPFAGEFASALFAFGFLNASIFGAAIVPVTTAYVITSAFGIESGLNYKYREAPQFYGLFLTLLVLGGIVVMLPFLPLITILVVSQAINAILLIPIFIFLYILSNDKKILGEYANSKFVNILVIITLIGISFASTLYLISLFFPNLLNFL
ncbi:MAG TPA: divalent metal cation transporter [Candidatus Sulfotelmatobacter sp.]|nr:divalent metal cation transporter [Candidatus Sulfotelmatobacter sp.]